MEQIPERSLDAILGAVGEKYTPKNLDRAALGSDLYRVQGAYEFVLNAPPPTRQAAKEAMDAFIKDLKRFRSALKTIKKEGNPVQHILSLAQGNPEPSLEDGPISGNDAVLSLLYGGVRPIGWITELIDQVTASVSQLEELASEFGKREKEFSNNKLQHKAWLEVFNPKIHPFRAETIICAKLLPDVFEKHFRRKAGVSTTVKKGIDGPAIRFMDCALREFGIVSPKTRQPLAPSAIAEHIKNRKKLRGLPSLDELAPTEGIED